MRQKGLNQFTILCWLSLVLISSSAGYGQGWEATYTDLLNPYTCTTPDGGIAMLATRTIGNQQTMTLYKLDDKGQVQWNIEIAEAAGNAIGMTIDQKIVVLGTKKYGFGNSDILMAEYDLLSNQIWQKLYDFTVSDEAACLEVLPDGLLVAANSADQIRLIKTDESGNLYWTKTYSETFGQHPTGLTLQAQGNILIATQRPGLPILAPAAYLIQTNPVGDLQYTPREFLHYSNFSTTNVAAVCVQSDTSYWFAHRDSVYELDTLGFVKTALRLPAQYNLFITSILPAPDGGFYALGTDYTFANPAQSQVYFGHFSSLGVPQWIRNYPVPSFTNATWGAQFRPKNQFLITGHYATGSSYFSYLIHLDEDGQAFTNRIEGDLFHDLNQNCSKDSNEPVLSGWFVRTLHPNGTIHYAVTDTLGHYSTNAGYGMYSVAAIAPNSLWQSNGCNTLGEVNFGTAFQVQTIDFPIQSEADCPLGWIDIDYSNWQPCTQNTIFVAYANKGNALMPDAKVTLHLDSLLTLVSASNSFALNGNNEYVFDIGDLLPLEKGGFTALVQPACNGLVQGQSLCIEADISPYSPCYIEGKAFLNITGVCDGDSIRFTVQNLGGPMQQPQEFVIIEDNLMYKRAGFQLGAGGSRVESVPSNGSTWRFETPQAAFLPTWQTDPLVAAVVEGCTSSGAFSTGYLAQYSLFDGAYYTETTCRTVEPTYTRQLKTAIPTGYGLSNNIPQNTDFEYTIYFQNTGSDTAVSVILTDTLDHQVLDIASLEPGVSSWPYRWQVTGEGILTMDFPDIVLPDSMSNPESSRGWVKFRIKQWPNLDPGTVIKNRAEVSFNYGMDATAGEVFHTVVKALTYTDQVNKSAQPYYLYPMPTEGDVTIVAPKSSTYRVVITNVEGKNLEEMTLNGHVLSIPCQHLPAGLYWVSVWSAQERLSTMKIVKL